MNGRRGTVDWASAPDEGDAATASRETGAWLARQERGRDWERVLPRLRDALAEVSASPLVRVDPACRDILASIRPDRGGAALVEALARLEARAGILTRAATSPAPPVPPRIAAEATPGPARRRRFWI